MQPGIYQISNAQYHASDGISRSAITELQISPLNYYDRYLATDREKKESSKAMKIGSVLHTLVLERPLFCKEFIVQPKIDRRTTEGKLLSAQFEMQCEGKIIIDEEDYQLASKMADAVANHSKCAQLLNGARVEQSIYWHDSDTGMLCKARPDVWNTEINVLCDLKTAYDSSPGYFASTVKSGNYHIQAAMQIDAVYATTGKLITDFAFIVVQNQRPHTPYIYRLDDETIQFGRSEYKKALRVFKKCTEINRWDLDREMVQPIKLLPYQFNQSPFDNLLEIYQCQI